jgi:protein-S-isoprenylcysteine O-methyltransferase Ste14
MPASSGSPSRGSRGEGWVVAQALLLTALVVAGVVGPAWDELLGWEGALLGTVLLVIGAVVLAAGLTLVVAGLRALGPGATPLPRPRQGGELVVTGLYARARHPVYGGVILGGIGWALLTASVVALVLAAALVPFFMLKSRREEAWLVEHYPGYAEYRRRTRRRFLPG